MAGLLEVGLEAEGREICGFTLEPCSEKVVLVSWEGKTVDDNIIIAFGNGLRNPG